MADYESETTRFLQELMRKHPDLPELQRRNRATWWDCKVDAEEQRQFRAADEPKPGYAYFPVPAAGKHPA